MARNSGQKQGRKRDNIRSVTERHNDGRSNRKIGRINEINKFVTNGSGNINTKKRTDHGTAIATEEQNIIRNLLHDNNQIEINWKQFDKLENSTTIKAKEADKENVDSSQASD